MAARPSIDDVWRRIKALEGEPFETKTGMAFTYTVVGDTLRTTRTDYGLSKGEFAKALDLVPLDGPGEIGDLVRGSAYVWAILHDRRVRLRDW